MSLWWVLRRCGAQGMVDQDRRGGLSWRENRVESLRYRRRRAQLHHELMRT